jgi:predicted RNA-binding Zn-ribbon protein involved in translation (DUF1610 family)
MLRCNVAKTTTSADELWFQHYLEYQCADCGNETAFRSRRRTFSERFLLPLFLLQPVRCSECFRRDYRLIFMPVRQRLPEAKGKPPASVAKSDGQRNVA